MDIALVFPKSTFLIDSLTWPPLGLWYLASQLEAQGHKTEFFDLSVDKFPDDGDFDQVWISATSPQMSAVREIGNITKDWKKTPTIFGGAAAWANPEECEKLPFDYVVSGESDHPLFVRYLSQVIKTSHTKLLYPSINPDLSWTIPPIRKWSYKYQSYIEDSYGESHRMSSIFTSRGCPQSCSFCESGRNGVIWGSKVRYEPLFNVEYQLREIYEMGHGGVMYYDDQFILNKSRAVLIMEIHKKYPLVFRCNLRSDIGVRHGFDFLRYMRDHGLVEVFVGVESADNQIKNNIHKGTTIEQDTQVLKWCKELGIRYKASFILGLPGESRESMEATRKWILENRPDRASIDLLIPFPGTPIYKNRSEYDLNWDVELPEEWFYKGKRGEGNSFVSTSYLNRDEIDQFRKNLDIELGKEGIAI